jgi:hypothetical protein
MDRSSKLTTPFWEGDLIVENPRNLSHLRIRKLWIRVVVYESPFFIKKKKKKTRKVFYRVMHCINF